jgi:phytoene dehydrogenase-like protein
MATVDAVVIGSGPNGLVAANRLADAGWHVVVLEGQPDAGGAVRTAEVTAPGFRNDLCSAFYPLSARPSPISALGLESYGLRWCRSPTVLTHLTPDDRSVTLSTDLAETEASVERFAAGDGLRWRRLYREWAAIEERLLAALFTPFPPVRAGLGLLRTVGLGDALRLARRFLLPAKQLGRERFSGEGARLLLSTLALHADVPPGTAASGGYGLLLAMLGQRYGFPVPRGGAGALIAAMVDRLGRLGGEVVCGAPVDHIEVRQGVARSVSTVDGRRWLARRAVVADIGAVALYRDLLDPAALPVRLLDDLTAFEYDGSTVKVDWALAGPVPWSDPAASRSGTVHLGVDLGGLDAYSSALEAGRLPTDPLVICGQMTTCDPSRSPAGTESMWAYTHIPHRTDWAPEDVATVVTRVEEHIERRAPGFRDQVKARRVAGPAELEAENANLVGGALAGGTNAVHQQLVFRPVPGLGRADTPVDRLFLASASAHPGGGVHGAPGANAARAALARDGRLTGWAYGRLIGSAQRRLYRL